MTVGLPLDLDDALKAFDEEGEKILRTLTAELDGNRPPPTIYHYTDDKGLHGILEFGTLWFTDIFNLNDPSELRHGLRHAVDMLNARAAGGLPETTTFASMFAALLYQGGLRAIGHYFVCSLSRSGDDLGQWRAYADNGRGFALGFKGPELEDACSGPHGSSFHVMYDDARLLKDLERIIELAFPLISAPRGRNLPSAVMHSYMDRLYELVAVHVVRMILFFKHEAYRNEEEYRLLELYSAASAPVDARYRSKPYSLIRYREYDWRSVSPLLLSEIIVGPAADRDVAAQFIEDCRRAFHDYPIHVRFSEIPYRS